VFKRYLKFMIIFELIVLYGMNIKYVKCIIAITCETLCQFATLVLQSDHYFKYGTTSVICYVFRFTVLHWVHFLMC